MTERSQIQGNLRLMAKEVGVQTVLPASKATVPINSQRRRLTIYLSLYNSSVLCKM